MRKNILKLVLIIVTIGAVYGALKYYGATEYIKLENVPKIKEKVDSFGTMAPLVFIGFYIAAVVFSLPGTPITVLSGVAFGPILGVAYASIGSVIGVAIAFLIARYAARDMVAGWVEGNEQFRKIDEGVERQGWRMLMITRLVPLFPFNLQNYAYGLTKINFLTYFFLSWICMLPATIAYVQVGGALISGEGNLTKTLLYLALAGIFIVLVSLIPTFIRKMQGWK